MPQANRFVPLLFVVSLLAFASRPLSAAEHRLTYQPAPALNPLKGLVPYAGTHKNPFPHSLEFNYLPLGPLMTAENTFNWKPLEKLLDDIASRGHQAVVRIYLEYPGKSDGIPKFLINQGLKTHRYLNTNTQPFPPKQVITPDYEDKQLRAALCNFITTFGQKYDGDPRLGYITAGLLGTWGEWHCYPRDELFASPTVQSEVMDVYQKSFTKTPVLLRYPAGPKDEEHAPNHDRPFGYHDDSFAWATLETGKPDDSWFYMALLRAAGPKALDKWKTHPIGGEIRPEVWGCVFDENPCTPKGQEFENCVAATHVTWLMDTGMFEKATPERTHRALKQVARMGYEFSVTSVSLPDSPNPESLPISLSVRNTGLAPIYHDWKLELALIDSSKNIIHTLPTDWKLTQILPADPPSTQKLTADLPPTKPGQYHLLLRVVNPLKTGLPLRFANKEQDQHLPGWLSLAPLTLP